jgi:hypothetical protein
VARAAFGIELGIGLLPETRTRSGSLSRQVPQPAPDVVGLRCPDVGEQGECLLPVVAGRAGLAGAKQHLPEHEAGTRLAKPMTGFAVDLQRFPSGLDRLAVLADRAVNVGDGGARVAFEDAVPGLPGEGAGLVSTSQGLRAVVVVPVGVGQADESGRLRVRSLDLTRHLKGLPVVVESPVATAESVVDGAEHGEGVGLEPAVTGVAAVCPGMLGKLEGKGRNVRQHSGRPPGFAGSPTCRCGLRSHA